MELLNKQILFRETNADVKHLLHFWHRTRDRFLIILKRYVLDLVFFKLQTLFVVLYFVTLNKEKSILKIMYKFQLQFIK